MYDESFRQSPLLSGSQTPRAAAPAVSTQPAIMKPTEEPPAYSQPQTKVAAPAPATAPQAAPVALYWCVDWSV